MKKNECKYLNINISKYDLFFIWSIFMIGLAMLAPGYKNMDMNNILNLVLFGFPVIISLAYILWCYPITIIFRSLKS